MNREDLQEALCIADRKHFRVTYLNPAIEAGLVELTIPDKPNSSKQRCRLTNEGLGLKSKYYLCSQYELF